MNEKQINFPVPSEEAVRRYLQAKYGDLDLQSALKDVKMPTEQRAYQEALSKIREGSVTGEVQALDGALVDVYNLTERLKTALKPVLMGTNSPDKPPTGPEPTPPCELAQQVRHCRCKTLEIQRTIKELLDLIMLE